MSLASATGASVERMFRSHRGPVEGHGLASRHSAEALQRSLRTQVAPGLAWQRYQDGTATLPPAPGLPPVGLLGLRRTAPPARSLWPVSVIFLIVLFAWLAMHLSQTVLNVPGAPAPPRPSVWRSTHPAQPAGAPGAHFSSTSASVQHGS